MLALQWCKGSESLLSGRFGARRDLVTRTRTRTGDCETRSVSGRLPDYPGELACMRMVGLSGVLCRVYDSQILTGKINTKQRETL